MKSKEHQRPPLWATRLLRWYCRPDLAEDLEGDLHEYFERNVQSIGVRRARLIYVIDVIKFFRLYTIRKPEFINLLIHWLMIGSYLKTSGRSIVRNKLFSAINIVGLAISMSVGLVLIAFVNDLLSYDRFHSKGDRIYRLCDTYYGVDGKGFGLASTSIRAGRLLQENVSGIEDLVILRRGFGGDAHFNDTFVPMGGMWATPSFFNVFDFPMLQGNPATALKDPYSIVITQETAKKIFGTEEALGKTILFDTVAYAVTGVIKDVPKSSHMRFESLVSFSTFDIQHAKEKDQFAWESIWMNYVYLLLPEHTDFANFQAKLDALAKEQNKTLEHKRVELWVQPLFDIALGKDLSNQIGPTMMISVIYVIGGLAFIVILSACFNYTNLSIARSLRRTREVGIRKVIGALKTHVLAQFVIEAVLISLFALFFAFFLFLLIRPHFLGLAPEVSDIVQLELTPRVFVLFIGLAVFVGVLAGFLPALFFSRINAVQVLKNVSTIKGFKNVNIRKALIVVQYTLSLSFIAATLIGYKQYKHFLNFNLGFKTENILNINLSGNDPKIVEKELAEIPEVTDMSRSLMVTSVGSYWGASVKYKNPIDSASAFYNAVDEKYFPMHGHQFAAGRNFHRKGRDSEESEVIINEKLMKRLEMGNDPQKVIGEEVKIDGKKMTVIGVLKDFHYGKAADNELQNVFFRYFDERPGDGVLNVLITSKDLPATIEKIRSAWKKIDKVHPFDAKFYDEQIERAYSEFDAMLKMIGFLSFLAISIASMGLLGMVVFTTETRLKEVSVRKVLGASVANLIFLLSRSFIIMLSIASLIALPATYIFFEQVVLSNMAFHAPIGVGELLMSVFLVMVIACIMIGSQTFRVARTNPAQVLKNE